MEVSSKDIKSIPATFRKTALARGDSIAMRHKDFGLWHEISWIEYYQQSSYLAHALMNLGIAHGDFVGIIGENCPKWLFMDMGIQMAGGRTVGIYTTNSWQQVKYILEHSECKVLFAENEEQVDKWLQMRNELPQLEFVIYWEKKGLEKINEPGLLFFDDVISQGRRSFELDPELHLPRIEKVNPDDIALLVYTSGTTGKPKGAMLSGRNILWVAYNLKQSAGIVTEGDSTMSYLPMCHIFERMFSVYLPLVMGNVINFAESIDTISQNISEIRPTVGYAVPRVWEKFQSSILIKMEDAPRLNRLLFAMAMRVGSKYTEKKLMNKKIHLMLRFWRFILYWTVLYPLKFMMGMNNMRLAISGAAPISQEVLRFYHILGIPMLEGYGMTETCAIITVSRVEDYKLGTVGKPLEGTGLKLNEDGEILVRHPGVISGYYKNPEATSQALKDGWLHTGDLGEIDDDGYLKIVDRKKDLIITAGGKNIAPQKLENMLKASPYINDAIVIGDNRKFLVAIIVLDEENVNKYARDHKIQYSTYSELASDPRINGLIEREVDKINKEVARVENIRKFTILDKRLYVEDGEVTPTMKVKRSFINKEYKAIIENMYA